MSKSANEKTFPANHPTAGAQSCAKGRSWSFHARGGFIKYHLAATWTGGWVPLLAGRAAANNFEYLALLCRCRGWQSEWCVAKVGVCEGQPGEGALGPKIQWTLSGGGSWGKSHVTSSWGQAGMGGAWADQAARGCFWRDPCPASQEEEALC